MRSTLQIAVLCWFSLLDAFGSDQVLRLDASVMKQSVRVSLVNESTDDVWVDRRMAIGPMNAGWNELVIKVWNEKMDEVIFASRVRIDPPVSEDRLRLRPGEIVGRDIPLEQLATFFHLSAGKYRLKVRYAGKVKSPDCFEGVLFSEVVLFGVSEDGMIRSAGQEGELTGTGPKF